MPVSDGDGKDWALDRYRDLRPGTVIDIGPGVGTYASLMRPHHRAHWTAVEAWGPYVDQYRLADLYDRVIVADARYLDRGWLARDLVIAGDVLEHMPAGDALTFIRTVQACAGALLVSVPLVHLEQGAVNGNGFERHLHHWMFPEMSDALGPGVTDSYEGPVLGCWLWEAR